MLGGGRDSGIDHGGGWRISFICGRLQQLVAQLLELADDLR